MCGCDPSINGISVRQNEIKLSQYSQPYFQTAQKTRLKPRLTEKQKKKKTEALWKGPKA